MLESENVEKLFTFVELEKEFKKTNKSSYEFPGRIPPDAVRTSQPSARTTRAPA